MTAVRSILQTPLVAFGAVIELLRRIPGYRQIEDRASLVVLLLMLIALVLFGTWMAQRSPQRVSMAQLVDGNVSSMQSWIIVSGEVQPEESSSAVQRYVLTDPAVPNARLIVTSDGTIPTGPTTVSGTLIGGSRGAQGDFLWLGQLRADPVLAREPDPPWSAIAFAGVALLFGFGSRTTYPMFFRGSPRPTGSGRATLPVGVRRDWPPFTDEAMPGSLILTEGKPVELSLPGHPTQVVRVHSARSSIETGVLRRVGSAEPAMLVRATGGELTLTFASAADRDSALAALMSDAAGAAVATR